MSGCLPTTCSAREGQGIQTFFASFNLTRICNASHLIGVARSAIDDAVRYATQRNVGDSKVADFQGIQWMIADLAVKLQTAQLVRDKAAWMEDAGLKHETETAMAKLLAVELVDTAANKAFSIVGGYGSYRTTSFERYLRDAKIGHVTGGSPEIMRNNIARAVLREYGYRPARSRAEAPRPINHFLLLRSSRSCAVIILRTSSGSMPRPIRTRSRSSAKDEQRTFAEFNERVNRLVDALTKSGTVQGRPHRHPFIKPHRVRGKLWRSRKGRLHRRPAQHPAHHGRHRLCGRAFRDEGDYRRRRATSSLVKDLPVANDLRVRPEGRQPGQLRSADCGGGPEEPDCPDFAG